jgi:DNA replication protein DnaC
MNNQATLEKLKALRLHGMERAFRTLLDSGGDRALSSDELMAQVTDAEYDERHLRKTKRLVKNAAFRQRASFPEIDFSLDRGLDRTTVLRLSDCGWIRAAKTIVISGPTGAGKSYLSHALGYQACSLGYRTLYFNCTKLFPFLKEKRASGGYQRLMAKLARTPLLILDDFGLSPLDAQDRLSLLELVEDRLGKAATVIATQIPVAQWFGVIGDPTIADAICDRVVPQAIRIQLSGTSIRLLQGQGKFGLDYPSDACVNPAS